jgi:hypothetical protein
MKTSKKLFILTAVVAGSFIATKSYSQVVIGAHIGFRVPAPRVYVGATIPAPVYAPAPAPVYDGGYYADPAVCEAEFPGYAYYDYPAWDGHYRDRIYFEHYRPVFYRDHAAYFYHGGFNHAGWAHDHGFGYHGGGNRVSSYRGGGYHEGGYHGGGYHDNGYHGGGEHRGGYHGGGYRNGGHRGRR